MINSASDRKYFIFFFFRKKAESEEEGELKDLHPLATVTDIDPDDIPDVPVNKFLMRGPQERDRKMKNRKSMVFSYFLQKYIFGF